MKRIFNIGILPEDRRARSILERIGKIEHIFPSATSFHPLRPYSYSPKPDFLLLSINSIDDAKKVISSSISIPTILVGEYYSSSVESFLPLPSNIYFSNYNPLTLSSILKALFKSAQNIKIELTNGSILNLISSHHFFKLEKLIPTGKGKEKEIGYKEGIILRELFYFPGKIVPYERFISLGIKADNLPVYMSKIRKIIKEIEPLLKIKSVRNRGYLLSYSYGL